MNCTYNPLSLYLFIYNYLDKNNALKKELTKSQNQVKTLLYEREESRVRCNSWMCKKLAYEPNNFLKKAVMFLL